MDYKLINDVILRYLTGECSESEEKELLSWRNLSTENREYFEKIKYTWVSSAQLRKEPVFEADDAFLDLEATLSAGKLTVSSSAIELNPKSRKIYIQKILKYAAIFVFMFIVGGISSLFLIENGPQKKNISTCYYEVPIGSRGKATLPDGTKVWLNAGSKLTYSSDYNERERIVKLEGEGFFDVITNPKKPFIVKARGIDIKAYGTSFNVKAYTDEKEIVTTLVKGKVFIEGKDKHNKTFAIQMKPKQSVTFFADNQLTPEVNENKEQGTISTPEKENNILQLPEEKIVPVVTADAVRTELFTSWKDDRWVIENAELTDLIKMLERRYNVTISINPDELTDYHFSGTIQNENIEQVLNIIRFTLPLKYNIVKNKIELKLDLKLKQRYIKAL